MLINNINILSKYKSILIERDIQASEIVTYNDWLEQSSLPFELRKEKFKYSNIKVKLLVEGDSEKEVLNNISNIIMDSKKGELKFTDLDFFYTVVLDSHGSEKIFDKAYNLELIFKSDFKTKNEITETMNRITTKTINVAGNVETPCVVEITPSIDIIDITIEGLADDPIVIKNLKGNKKLIIGEDTVTVDGINKFNDTDMWEFPRLKPGANTIKVSKSNVNINIKYKGRWI